MWAEACFFKRICEFYLLAQTKYLFMTRNRPNRRILNDYEHVTQLA